MNIDLASQRAADFIAHFSTKPLEEMDPVNTPWRDLLNENEKNELREKVSPIATQLRGIEKAEDIAAFEFSLVGKGKHHFVWEHPKFQGMVLKLTRPIDADKQTRVAMKIHTLIEQNRFKVRSPVATVVDLPDTDYAIYVEEKLPLGMNEKEHQEFWARIFIHVKSSECSPTFTENLLKMVKEISELVLKIGVWDIGVKNLPEVASNGQYLCATDFENVSEDLSNVPTGLTRLANLFCHDPCIQYLENQYIQNGLESDFTHIKDWVKNEFGDTAYERFLSKNSQETHFDAWKENLSKEQKESLRLQEALKAKDEKTEGSIHT